MKSERAKLRWMFFGIIFLAVITAIFDFPGYYNKSVNYMREKFRVTLPKITGKPFLLGLDLQGGTHLVYEADVSGVALGQRDSAIEGVKDVLDRRVNAFGVSEPIIQSSRSGDSWKVIVELAGVRDVNQAIQMIGETPQLDFRLQTTTTAPILTPEEQQELEKYNNGAKKIADDILKKAKELDANFDGLVKDYSEEESKNDTNGLLGFQKKDALKENFLGEIETACFDKLKKGEVYRETVQTQYGYHIVKKFDERGEGDEYEANCQQIYVKTKTAQEVHPVEEWIQTELSGEHLTRTQVIFDPNSGAPQVSLQFNEKGRQIFEKLTSENIGRIVGIFLDNNVISAPRVNEAIIGGNAVISGSFSIQEAKILSQRLNAGALRVPIKLVSQQTVGPTLGKISVQESIYAALIGLGLVSLFMIFFYRVPGFLANIALLIYGFLNLAIYKLMPVTLTLSGIAGFILSLGMAVDANILVFERMKEEMKSGKPLDRAIDEGFRRAWPSIRDGNYSTLITSLILMWFSTSIVKGFAITLSIGIFVSIFTSMVITKIFLKIIIKKSSAKRLWLFGLNKR